MMAQTGRSVCLCAIHCTCDHALDFLVMLQLAAGAHMHVYMVITHGLRLLAAASLSVWDGVCGGIYF